MNKLQNYAFGRWTPGAGAEEVLLDAVTGEPVASVNVDGPDFGEMMHFARSKGNKTLRKMTFHERGRMLKALALYLNEKKEDFYKLSYHTGATRIDSWIDIEGGIGNLFAYASLRKFYPDKPYFVEGEPAKLSREGTFIGHHLVTL